MTTLYNFPGAPNAALPGAYLVSDSNGVLYGVASDVNRTYGFGVVFSLTPPDTPGGSWTATVLHKFAHSDGYPASPLLITPDGRLYGTAPGGGSNGLGTVFEMRPPVSSGGAWRLTALYNFMGGSDGQGPIGGVIMDQAGALYGTTQGGGFDAPTCVAGCGTVFELTPPAAPGGVWSESILHSFTDADGDGRYPESGVVLGRNGRLYGATLAGGSAGNGTVFELLPPASPGAGWTKTVLHAFAPSDGNLLAGGLILTSDGSLYGTAEDGGASDDGTVFQMTPPTSPGGTWTESVLHSFNGKDGRLPVGGVVMGSNGALYGTTTVGAGGGGAIFELKPPAEPGGVWQETVLHRFPRISRRGAVGLGGVLLGGDGLMYGTTAVGGTGPCKSHRQVVGCGTVFQLTF